MTFVLARLGAGVPVDLEALLALAVAGVDWRPDGEYHVGMGEFSANELVKTLSLRSGGPTALSISLHSDTDIKFGALFSLHGASGHAHLDLPASGGPHQFDGLAAVADQLTLYSESDRASRARWRTASASVADNTVPIFCLPAVAEVHWFGERLVDWFGGDQVFASMPAEWAERTEFGQWRVIGLDPEQDPDGFQADRWSVRERAIIEHLGRQFFFDVDAGVVPETPPQPPVGVASYESYLWHQGELVISSVGGSIRSVLK